MVDDVDALRERFQALGIAPLHAIGDRSYGLRDFTLADPSGFGNRFAQRRPEPAHDRPSSLGPPRVSPNGASRAAPVSSWVSAASRSAAMSFDILDNIRDAVRSVVQAVTEPPPPPPAQTAEQIEARVNAATSDPEQRELLTRGYTQAQQTGDGALWQQTDGLATLYHDRQILALSRFIDPVDSHGQPNDDLPEGWSRATPEQLAAYGLTEADLRPNGATADVGFRAELFIPDPEVFGPDATPVLQFEGTNFSDPGDVNADVAQAMGNDEEFYNRAIDIATRASQASGGEIVFSGHSLGGGLATAAGLATGAPTIVSNPAGVHPDTVADVLAERGLSFEGADGNISTYVVDGDLLTELQDATAGLSGQNADSFAAILNGVGHAMNLYQDDAVFPTDVTGQQVQELPDAVGEVTTLDARNADGSARPGIVPLDTIVDDVNDHVAQMPVDDFAGLVEDGTDIVDQVTGFLGGVANGTGDVLNTVSDHVPDFGIFGGIGDLVSGGGDVVATMGDYVEQGGDITLDIAEGLETAGAVAIEAADGEVRDSVTEMVDRHSFGVFDGALQSTISDREQALQEQLG